VGWDLARGSALLRPPGSRVHHEARRGTHEVLVSKLGAVVLCLEPRVPAHRRELSVLQVG
jgi:hypothetical protein